MDRVKRMLEKRRGLGGLICGFHGTSQKRARRIMKCGFKNCRCDEGGYGVYFWDEEFRKNALEFARKKAVDDDDNSIAIIKVIANKPEPDWLEGRPQWIAPAEKIGIIKVEYLSI